MLNSTGNTHNSFASGSTKSTRTPFFTRKNIIANGIDQRLFNPVSPMSRFAHAADEQIAEYEETVEAIMAESDRETEEKYWMNDQIEMREVQLLEKSQKIIYLEEHLTHAHQAASTNLYNQARDFDAFRFEKYKEVEALKHTFESEKKKKTMAIHIKLEEGTFDAMDSTPMLRSAEQDSVAEKFKKFILGFPKAAKKISTKNKNKRLERQKTVVMSESPEKKASKSKKRYSK